MGDLTIKWFKHQADANLNAKLQEVILDHGMEGYGLYWFCIELVAMNVTSAKLTFELEHDARIISRMTGVTTSKVELIMTDFIKLDLFSASEGRIQCLKLAKRCDDFTAKAIRANGLQTLENKGVRQSPTNSEKVPLEDRSKKVEKEDRSKKKVSQKLDYSSWPSIPSDDVLKEWLQHRTRQKAKVTQLVVTRLAKELAAAVQKGYSVDDCLAECVVRGWRGFEADWMKPKPNQVRKDDPFLGAM